ncbi:glycine receptor subunit beta-like [Penaeus japonicus]|uniref:glycine receptor subunit beta-like n=1 Tax=Penaeus japonicus TaxID=27405 RepID=UPI001C713601|nr:glycine receptor subunit beta-like [Penaeus japonicus]
MSVTLSCHFDFHQYPHDEQTCEMLIQSLSYESEAVRFEWCESWAHADSKLDHDIFSLPHFTLANYEHEVCNGKYPCVKAVFVLVRHPDFHILHTYVPTVLIVILSWMSFWITPDATPESRLYYSTCDSRSDLHSDYGHSVLPIYQEPSSRAKNKMQSLVTTTNGQTQV